MAKLKMPLLSKTAHGQFGKKLNYYTKAGKTYTRRFHYPKRPPTGEQLTRRYITGLLTIRWQTMTTNERLPYNQAAVEESKKTGEGISGFNYFVKVASKDLVTHLGLLAFYPMNEGNGRIVKNFAGNFSHGTFLPALPASGLEWAKSKNDLFGTCLKSNGSNNYLLCQYDSRLNIENNISLVFFLSLNAFSNNIEYVFRRGGCFAFYKTESNILVCSLTTVNRSFGYNIPASFFVPGVMNQITLTYNKNLPTANFKLYFNKTLISTRSEQGVLGQSTDPFILFAASNNFRLSNIRLDNVMQFNRVLSASEVEKINNLMSEPKLRQKFFE